MFDDGEFPDFDDDFILADLMAWSGVCILIVLAVIGFGLWAAWALAEFFIT